MAKIMNTHETDMYFTIVLFVISVTASYFWGASSSWSKPAKSSEFLEARNITRMLNALREEEGATVTFCCDNPDFNGLPDRCIYCNASFTNWQDLDFRADTLEQCLSMALQARADHQRQQATKA